MRTEPGHGIERLLVRQRRQLIVRLTQRVGVLLELFRWKAGHRAHVVPARGGGHGPRRSSGSTVAGRPHHTATSQLCGVGCAVDRPLSHGGLRAAGGVPLRQRTLAREHRCTRRSPGAKATAMACQQPHTTHTPGKGNAQTASHRGRGSVASRALCGSGGARAPAVVVTP